MVRAGDPTNRYSRRLRVSRRLASGGAHPPAAGSSRCPPALRTGHARRPTGVGRGRGMNSWTADAARRPPSPSASGSCRDLLRSAPARRTVTPPGRRPRAMMGRPLPVRGWRALARRPSEAAPPPPRRGSVIWRLQASERTPACSRSRATPGAPTRRARLPVGDAQPAESRLEKGLPTKSDRNKQRARPRPAVRPSVTRIRATITRAASENGAISRHVTGCPPTSCLLPSPSETTVCGTSQLLGPGRTTTSASRVYLGGHIPAPGSCWTSTLRRDIIFTTPGPDRRRGKW